MATVATAVVVLIVAATALLEDFLAVVTAVKGTTTALKAMTIAGGIIIGVADGLITAEPSPAYLAVPEMISYVGMTATIAIITVREGLIAIAINVYGAHATVASGIIITTTIRAKTSSYDAFRGNSYAASKATNVAVGLLSCLAKQAMRRGGLTAAIIDIHVC